MLAHIFTTGLCLLLVLPGLCNGQTKGLTRVQIKDESGNAVGLYRGSHALIIGVSNYTAGWPRLPSVVGETKEVEEALSENGFSVRRVLNPDYEALKDAFEDFIDQYGYDKDNRLLFFFSGHGYSRNQGEKGYIVPTDAPLPQQDETGFLRAALPMSQVLAWCRQMEARHALFLFDSCFSGTIFKSKALPKTPPHISKLTSQPVRQFITAGDEDEEVPAKSVFTDIFIRALRGEADLTRDGYVTGTELGLYLQEKVLYYKTGQTPQYGKIRDPDLDEGDFVFVLEAVKGPPPPPPPPKRPRPAESPPGHLQVNVNVPNTRVYVDGTYRGQASPGVPLNFQDVGLGEVTVRVEAKGYQSLTQSLELKSNTWTQAVLELPVLPPPKPALPSIPSPPSPKSGADGEMVFIPAGEFRMGSVNGGSDEKPVHRVDVGGFSLDKYEVTNAQYTAFVKAEGHRAPDPADWGRADWNRWRNGQPPSGMEDHPVVGVSWSDAVAYCKWKGKRLPTEAEWEKACRGGLEGKRYPWGDRISPEGANYKDSGKGQTVPAGSYQANGYGLHDMSGNVWEWVSSKYKGYPYRAEDGRENIDNSGDWRVLRGGSWAFASSYVRCAARGHNRPHDRLDSTGFRCAR